MIERQAQKRTRIAAADIPELIDRASLLQAADEESRTFKPTLYAAGKDSLVPIGDVARVAREIGVDPKYLEIAATSLARERADAALAAARSVEANVPATLIARPTTIRGLALGAVHVGLWLATLDALVWLAGWRTTTSDAGSHAQIGPPDDPWFTYDIHILPSGFTAGHMASRTSQTLAYLGLWAACWLAQRTLAKRAGERVWAVDLANAGVLVGFVALAAYLIGLAFSLPLPLAPGPS